MLRIRLIEEEIAARYAEQEMRCPVHLSVGQEAAAVGACAALRPADQITSSHRCHGHYLAKGGDLRAMLAEIYGKAAGCCGGRGGSMHLFDPDAGVLASVPIVASSVPLAVGAALAFQQRAEDGVAVAFLGDGSLEEGVTHESLNFASRFHLPVVFFVENNFFSVYTPLDQRQPARPLAALAAAHGMPALEADGNDVLAVLKATKEAVADARAGAGPTLIVAETYRWREHCGPNYDNDLGYRTEDEFLAWKARDPVAAFAARLSELGAMTDTDSDAMAGAIGAEIDAAFGFAKAAPFPDGATAAERVYA
ncbi:MAG: thiamine pyrophosphate-dependent dehydrogenase E1 component subunit alpha [Hyphomicrobiales bacterium]|nr:thiamine pyrophosphate-dependent dehydrogenase E1 component subunit alpha [Hyphomicrobiales bacterium]MCP5373635.1 thiamine pyrophosphate-dependent dehydrogenase E1 component subunit alpha [Hyphomicrobiales bacterium]